MQSNRKLFIARQIEKLFGLVFSCTDVTNTFVGLRLTRERYRPLYKTRCKDLHTLYVSGLILTKAPNELLDDIDDMSERHSSGSIFLPTFQPYIVYSDRTERALGQRR